MSILNSNFYYIWNVAHRAYSKVLNLKKSWAGAKIPDKAINIITTSTTEKTIKDKGWEL